MCSFDISKINDLVLDIKLLFKHKEFFKAFEKCNMLPLSLIELHLNEEYKDAINTCTQKLLQRFNEKDLSLEIYDQNQCSFITYMCSMEALLAHSKEEFFVEYEYLQDAINYCSDPLYKKYKSLLQKRFKSLSNTLTTHSNKAFFKRCEECAYFFNEREEKIFNLAKRDKASYKKALDIVREGLRLAFPTIDYDDFEVTLDLGDEEKAKYNRDDELNFVKYEEKSTKSDDLKLNTVYIALTKLDDVKKVHLYYYFTHLLEDANFDILTFIVGGGLNFFENYQVVDNFGITHFEDECMAYISFDETYLKEVKAQYKSLTYTYNQPFINLKVVSNSLSRLNDLDNEDAIFITKKLLANTLGEIMTSCILDITFVEEDKKSNKKLISFTDIRDYLDKNHVRCRNSVATYMSIHNLNFSGKHKRYGFRETISFGESRILELDLALKNDITIPYEYFYKNGVLAGSVSFDCGEFNLSSKTNDTQEILSDLRHFMRFLLNQSMLEIGVALRYNNFKEYQDGAYYLDILSFEEHDMDNLTNFLRHKHVKRAYFTPFLKGAKPIELINDKTYKDIDNKKSIELIDINDFNKLLFTKKGPKALFKNSVLDLEAKNNILLSLKEKDYARAYASLYSEFNKSYEDNNKNRYEDDLFCSLVSGIIAINLKRYMIAFRSVKFFDRNYKFFDNNPYVLALYLNALFITGKNEIAYNLVKDNLKLIYKKESPIALKILAISIISFKGNDMRLINASLYKESLKEFIDLIEFKNEELAFKERIESMYDAKYASEDFFMLLKDEQLTKTSSDENLIYKDYVSRFNLSFDKDNFIDLIRMMGFDLKSYRVNAPFCYFKMTVDSHSFNFIFDGNTNAMSHLDIHNESLQALLEKIKSGAFNEIKNENGDIAHVCAIIFKFDDFKNPSVIYKKDMHEDSNYFFFNYSIENKSLNGPMYYEEKRTLDEIVLKLESDECDNNADDIMPQELLNKDSYDGKIKKDKALSTSRFYKAKSKEENALSVVLIDDNNKSKKDKKSLKTHILKIDDINC